MSLCDTKRDGITCNLNFVLRNFLTSDETITLTVIVSGTGNRRRTTPVVTDDPLSIWAVLSDRHDTWVPPRQSPVVVTLTLPSLRTYSNRRTYNGLCDEKVSSTYGRSNTTFLCIPTEHRSSPQKGGTHSFRVSAE